MRMLTLAKENSFNIAANNCSCSSQANLVSIFLYSRTCVNGQVVTERTQLLHGDRILLGNNHFFRLNCPHTANTTQGLFKALLYLNCHL